MNRSGKKPRFDRRGVSARRGQIQVKIEDLNENGAGVAFYQKLRINVEKTLPGEKVLLEYQPSRSHKDRIQLIQILETSSNRREAPCEYFEECGGCQLQHLEYRKQLQFKQQVIQRLLLPYPPLKQIKVRPVEGMPEPLYYRNKTQIPWQVQRGDAVFGLFRSGTHEVVPVDRCIVETRDANQALQIVRDWANYHEITIYDENHHRGILRHVVVRRGIFTNQLMVVVVSTTKEVPHWQTLLQQLKNGLPTLRSVQININSRQTNVILGEENILAWGEPFIEERLMQQRFRIFPNTFFQVNSVQMVKLLERMTEVAEFKGGDTVVDLFCGIGAISLHLAGLVKTVVGIESYHEAVAAALQNSTDNNITNAAFHSGDAREKFVELLKEGLKPDIIIVDPPRKGLEKSLIQAIGKSGARAVIYISCNPKTLVRDLDVFDQQGYAASDIFPFDMFPQTYHVESLAVLKRGEAEKSPEKE